jgi:hypothetical protein
MRAEVERAFQDGGMVNEIIERSTNPEPGENLTQMIIKNRDDAMARLRAGREAIAQRRSQQQERDESSKWLAFAQGMLAPTQTGGFGETLGATAGLMRQEQEVARGHESERLQEEMLLAEQEQGIQDDYIDQLQAQARIEKTSNLGEFSRPRPIGVAQLVPHPEDPSKLARVQQVWRPDLEVPQTDDDGQPILDENGEPVITLGGTQYQYVDEVGPDGSIPFAVSPLDIERAQQLELVRGLGADQADRINNDIMSGRDAWPVIQKYEMTMELMREVERSGMGTGGWVALLQGVAEWWGVDTAGVTRLGELRNRLGQAVLEGLQHFPGQISEGERKYMEALETGLSKPLGVNMALIEEGLRIQRQRYRRGVTAAREIGSNLDLRAMGIDPNAPPGTAPAGSPQGPRQEVPGSTRALAVHVIPGSEPPPAGTWVILPNGDRRKYPGRSAEETPPGELMLTEAPATPGG